VYLVGASVRAGQDISEALWGSRVVPGAVSKLNQKIYRHIEAPRYRQITGESPYLYPDGVILKRSRAREVRNVFVMVAFAIKTDGFRQILGVAEGEKEKLKGWRGFLRQAFSLSRIPVAGRVYCCACC
jgi:putative transposase